MKTTFAPKQNRAMTLVEVLVVIAVLVIFAAMILPPSTTGNKTLVGRIMCVNNLKQIGLATRVWADADNGKFPSELSKTNGGTMEFTVGPNAFRHFQVMSNELSTPKALICPTDRKHFAATNFVNFDNSNVSFFFDVDANNTNPQLILSGDSNITNGTAIRNGLLNLTTNELAGWTEKMHKKVGNVTLADGSVQQLSISNLRTTIANTELATNHLQMPVQAR